ncbi:hypothetical protein Tco_0604114 [Tanacetum coccineum]
MILLNKTHNLQQYSPYNRPINFNTCQNAEENNNDQVEFTNPSVPPYNKIADSSSRNSCIMPVTVDTRKSTLRKYSFQVITSQAGMYKEAQTVTAVSSQRQNMLRYLQDVLSNVDATQHQNYGSNTPKYRSTVILSQP